MNDKCPGCGADNRPGVTHRWVCGSYDKTWHPIKRMDISHTLVESKECLRRQLTQAKAEIATLKAHYVGVCKHEAEIKRLRSLLANYGRCPTNDKHECLFCGQSLVTDFHLEDCEWRNTTGEQAAKAAKGKP